MNDNNFEAMSRLLNLNNSQSKKTVKDSKIDKKLFATVLSYNQSTKKAVVKFPEDSTNITLPNLSGANLNTNDLVIVQKINGTLTNAYIDKLMSPIYVSMPFRGAKIEKTAVQSGFPDDVLITAIFNDVKYDTNSFWDSINNQFKIPANVSKVRITAFNTLTYSGSPTGATIRIVPSIGQYAESAFYATMTANQSFSSSVVWEGNVVEGQTFKVQCKLVGGTARNISAQGYFSIQVLE